MDSTELILRFEVFELDLRSSELTKNGVKIRLHDQPLKLLELLLERPGELVNREEIKARFWPNDTIVDFEYGIIRECQTSDEMVLRKGWRGS